MCNRSRMTAMVVLASLAAILTWSVGAPVEARSFHGGAPRMLYAPAESDDPTYRSLLASYIGGSCDYFDARFDTPSDSLLATYHCVHTWSSHPYNDPILFGDRLADFADDGGVVILGAYTTSQAGNLLDGRIVTSGYSPVTSLGAQDQMSAWDGTCREDCAWTDVPGVYAMHRATQTTPDPIFSTVCGRYVDGEVALAFNPGRNVAFVNGAAGFPYFVDPSMARLVANICMCDEMPPPVGACCFLDGSCLVMTFDDCVRDGGIYAGDGSVCEPNPCGEIPTGACCLPEGDCIIETETACLGQGTYYGDDSVCEPNPCPPVASHRVTWGGMKWTHRK